MDKLENIRSSEVIYNDMDKKCAPGVNFEHGSCINLMLLIEIHLLYN